MPLKLKYFFKPTSSCLLETANRACGITFE